MEEVMILQSSTTEVGPMERLREIVILDVEGTPPDSSELRSLLFDIGWEKSQYEELRAKVGRRFRVVENAQRVADADAERASITAKIDGVREECRNRVAELQAEIEAAWQPLRDITEANAQRLSQLDHICRPASGNVRDDLAASADPSIGKRIREFEAEDTSIADRIILLRSTLKPRTLSRSENFEPFKDVPESVEFLAGEIERLRREIDARSTSAEARDIARRKLVKAEARLAEMETAQQSIDQLIARRCEIDHEILALKRQQQDWRNFALN
jgi:DNA repair exonuclease SbcCD ATPase subunit